MDLSKIISVCAFYTIIRVKLVLSIPTFGNEFVHIKVHLPLESSSTEDVSKSVHPAIYDAPKHHVTHKIIHHYHRHWPIKKLGSKETGPVLENLYLAELDKLHSHDQHDQKPKYIEDTFLVEDQLDNNKEKHEITTVKVIEENQHQPHSGYGKNYPENVKLIDGGNHYYDDLDHHVDTVKIVDLKPQYQSQQEKHKVHDYNVPKEDVVKVIEKPKYTAFLTDYSYYGHDPYVDKEVDQLLDVKYLEFVKPKQDKNENKFQTQYDYLKPKEQKLSKFPEEYNFHPKVTHTHYHHSEEPVVPIEEFIEYEQPEERHHYSQKENQNVKYISTASETIPHYAALSAVEPHTSTYNGNEDNSHNNEHTYLKDYQKQLESSESSQDCNESNIKEDTLKVEENPNAAETYTGYDSYSAAHVQGLGSGRYRLHMP